MNLYIETLADYLKVEWCNALNATDGPAEARFIIQSLDPDSVFSLFQILETHRLAWLEGQSICCYFRVATELWRDWCSNPGVETELDLKMAEFGALGPGDKRLWIDEEDRLTWYRNRTTEDEGVDGLVVVLVGLDHATDQGGLADFHCVNEARIWQEMKQSFLPWLKRISERLAIDASDNELEYFDRVLQQLFQLRPLRLGQLAIFLERQVITIGDCYQWSDFTGCFFEQLPFWGIPPLLPADGQLGDLRGQKGALALKGGDAFISHLRYKTAAGQKKDWAKINTALGEAEFELPKTLVGEALYETVDAYRETLHSFIFEANPEAKSRLLQTDFSPLLRIFKTKPEPPGTGAGKTVPAFTGTSFEALLQGIWQTLEVFSKKCGDHPLALAEQLAGIHIELVHFGHDLSADDAAGIGAETLAYELLRGCLGGLDEVFENIDCRLPWDEDQAVRPHTQWDKQVPITLDLALDSLKYGVSRKRPNVQFKVTITNTDQSLVTEKPFKWILGPTQPERVRFECVRQVREQWMQCESPGRLLPRFQISAVAMTALYFAADEDEANRLLSLALPDLQLVNLLDGLTADEIDQDLWVLITRLITDYRAWLDTVVEVGYFAARVDHLVRLVSTFVDLAEKTLDSRLLGSSELLRRVYKAFLVVDERVDANDPYLPAAIAWGLSLPVLELTQARARFFADGFPEVVADLAIRGYKEGRSSFERLLDLAQIQRPLAALVVDANRVLSAEIKSFGLIHHLGSEPSTKKSLAVQTLLRDEDNDDDESVKDIIHPCEERDLVSRVLKDYQQLYPFAEDGLRLLAVNIRELQTILAGIDQFLDEYLKRTPANWPPFHCAVMVYSTSSSPMAMENRLALWRNHVLERHREKGRPLKLSVGHRYAPMEKIIGLLKREQRLYDIAFLFHFLRTGLVGRADPARPFEYSFTGTSGLQFPIAEYPRPIRAGDRYRRESLLSNRRLRIQTLHADLSARLCYPSNASHDHIIVGQVNYKPWVDVIETLHQKAQWVACVDPFVDKRLLRGEDSSEPRKIVGFSAGLGAYGELNLTISTEQDTLKQLTDQVANKLTKLLPFEQTDGFEAMATRVVGEAEEIIGLASLRAVVGIDERIREVVGFAAIRRAMAVPPGQMSQLLPMDSLQHWFTDSEGLLRPDLLQLTLEVRPNDMPLVHAVVVECKLGQKNPVHLAKAYDQVQEGLRHLTGLLAPEHRELRRLGFDRRYWWAQLHRAMSSRSVVKLPEQEWQELDHALESLAEGQFEIHWQAAIFTFWTNEAGPQPVITPIGLPAGTVVPPFEVAPEFVIQHLELGYQGLTSLFAETQLEPLLPASGPVIRLRPPQTRVKPPLPSEVIDTATSDESTQSSIDVTFQETDGLMATNVGLGPEATPTGGAVQQPVEDPVESGSDSVGWADSFPAVPPPEPVPPINIPGGHMVHEPSVEESVTGTSTTAALFSVPETILIGTRSNGQPVYWHFGHPKLANRHLLLFGASGSGKTYGIQCLLAEMAQQHLRSLIVDYTDGFLPQQVETRFSEITTPKNHFVVTERLPLNPFRRQSQIIDPSIPAIEEAPYQVATRIASIFGSIFDMGDQQSAALIRALQVGIEEGPDFTLDEMLPRLRDEGPNGETLANKLEPLIRAEPFRAGDEAVWEEMLSSPDNGVHVLQLKGMARDIQKMVTEFVLWDLWDYAQNSGSKNRPIPIVLDEIQNLDHSSDSPIDKMLREGRKFGLSMILATQTTSQFNQEQRDRLFQAGHKLFFKPATTEIDRFAQLLTQATTGLSKADWTQRLSSLQKGQCWSLGPVLKSGGTFKEEAVLVNVTSLEERRFED